MSSTKKEKIAKEEREWNSIDNAVVESNMFLWKYRSQLLSALVIIILLVGGYLGYKYFYVGPKNNEAFAALAKGEEYFQMQQDSLALYGDGNGYVGFDKIIQEYGSTDVGNYTKYLAAVSSYNLGKYDLAQNYAKDFSANDLVLKYQAQSLIGDCLVNEGKVQESISYFMNAAKGYDNQYYSAIAYKKAGLAYKQLKDYENMEKTFQTIKEQFTSGNAATSSPIVLEAQKYIDEAKMLKK